MNGNTISSGPAWLADLRTADHESGGRPAVPPDRLDEAREWLAVILVDVPDGLVPHVRQLERFYRGRFRAPLPRALLAGAGPERPPPDPPFRHTGLLTAGQSTAVLGRGISALGDAILFPEGEPTALARLLLNPYALFDLSDMISYRLPVAWRDRLEASGRPLAQQDDLDRI